MKMGEIRTILCCALFFSCWSQLVHGHGRLMDPPARNSMWRLGYKNPVNYNDNELFCGGYSKFIENGQKCGVCGDAYNASDPGAHEAGGSFANGIASRVYVAGQNVEIVVELTANHMGYFELKICPVNSPQERVTQECLDKYPLLMVGSDSPKFTIPEDSPKHVTFRYEVQLPPGLTCSQCVLQWKYAAGNTWGTCEDGKESVGCGVQETFINCADVVVTSNAPLLLPFKPSIVKKVVDPNSHIAVLSNHVISEQVCIPTERFARNEGMYDWCRINCLKPEPRNCPADMCYCPRACKAIGEFSKDADADVYCNQNCLTYPKTCDSDDPLILRADVRGTCIPECPSDKCFCY